MGKALLHLVLGYERLDDAQATQRLVQLGNQHTPKALYFLGTAFQVAADDSHHPSQQWHYHEHKQGEFPTDGKECHKGDNNGYRILDEHLERMGHDILQPTDIGTHAGNDIALPLMGEEA